MNGIDVFNHEILDTCLSQAKFATEVLINMAADCMSSVESNCRRLILEGVNPRDVDIDNLLLISLCAIMTLQSNSFLPMI